MDVYFTNNLTAIYARKTENFDIHTVFLTDNRAVSIIESKRKPLPLCDEADRWVTCVTAFLLKIDHVMALTPACQSVGDDILLGDIAIFYSWEFYWPFLGNTGKTQLRPFQRRVFLSFC